MLAYVSIEQFYPTSSHITVRQMAVKDNTRRLSLIIFHWMALNHHLVVLRCIDR
jgi:hypothetical protein